MGDNVHSNQKEKTVFNKTMRSLLIGTASGVVSCIVLLFSFASVMVLRDIPQTIVAVFSVVAVALGSLIGAFVAAKMMKQNGMLIGICCGLILYGIIILANLSIGSVSMGMPALLKLALIAIASAIGGVMGVNSKKKIRMH